LNTFLFSPIRKTNLNIIKPAPKNIDRLTFKGNESQACSAQLESDIFEVQNPRSERGRVKVNGKIFNRNRTGMFRIDLDWFEFANYIKKRFANNKRVNTYVYGCSNGSEAYTMSILLQNTFPDDSERFFPIHAKDIDSKIIKDNIEAKSNDKTRVHNAEVPAREYLCMSDEQIKQHIEVKGFKEYLLKNVTEPVEFSTANILDDITNIDEKHPSIVMCRNMWPYINPAEYETFAKNLYERLAAGSLVAIGSYDCSGEPGMNNTDLFPKALLKAGFKEPDSDEYKPEFLDDISHYTIFVKE